ncbi:seryl-tRNA synthetase [Methylocella silvestris BL2]|uniref:Serine--tRNA ligase n=1 Tax=Methylocella silvestris (strain DSM 15510 / CIP 108128 / LMG 27833 / NCIMB 13906 / BL2) TaxID=395965 RepID=SYS_METSB|nr:serine--tRNA ligase [Methylocella silvestris]B8ELG9.1 RecName: Full=Serine--tRNA ligase; AltName: Full=Seryl-tRNA synthetase; Short=SerRS; AltName: Full=Seryl-tRNA(Ser/Sec) synthetase [Methylocella silvestris BL2]ACK49558.1 seryl-tRNA synthetase [Methylocella silvestris BL2]
MYDIKWIRDNPEVFDQGRKRRGLEPLAARLLELDDARRGAIAKLQVAQERRNAASKEIGQAMAAKDQAKADALMAEVSALKRDLPELEAAERAAAALLDKALSEIPNLPLEEVPFGRDENDNREHHTFGEKPRFSFDPAEHYELGETLGLMDFETAAKLSGARFVVNKGPLARLERALGAFMLDLHTGEHGYTEVNPPILVRDDAMFGTAQLPKFENDQFWARPGAHPLLIDMFGREEAEEMKKNRLWLIPTAEVPLTNLVRESILDEKQLPLRFTASTPCFRAEAGSAGRDTRGMIRQHQFTKVELVSITTPEQALAEHERMLSCAEEVLKRLKLPYRVVTLCTGDMGFASQKTYDIEVWLPGQDRYREISSVSVCGDFQARRMNARYRPEGAKNTRFVHTLNGSGVAVGRALVAVLENYQTEDGSIIVPDALAPYMGGITRIEKPALERPNSEKPVSRA